MAKGYFLLFYVFTVAFFNDVHCGEYEDEVIFWRTCKKLKCLNGGYCEANESGRASCVCRSDYTGTNCQHRKAPQSIENLRCNNSCSSTTACRYCLPCDTCTFQTQCLNYDTLINDLDAECHAQGYQEALLVKTSSGPTGYTQMKCRGTTGSIWQCPAGSVCVDDERNGGTCCRNRVGIDYVKNKPGSCPPTTDFQYCGRYSCRGDIDCSGNMKCCQRCGNKCTNPYIDPCTSVTCYNGGRCLTRSNLAVCECPQGYIGTFCETKQDPCLSYRCNNGGQCLTNGLNPYCQCAQGYTGQFCDTRQDPCSTVTCYNGGRCVNRNNLAVCECPQGYVGSWCETRQDPCSRVTCYNGGRCVDRNNVAICECTSGYIGTWCETRQDPCLSYRCNNGGRCLVNGLSPYCQCVQGYTGQFCDTRQDPCLNYRCNNGGQCLTNGLNPYCQCVAGFTGQFCDTRVDPCLNYRCNNGGQCLANGLNPYCQCAPGFTGQFCDTRINPCLSYRCNNGGQCLTNGLNPYCLCVQGYTGQFCDTRIDPCSSVTCYNGGRCVSRNNLAVCECPQGYTGTWCETRQDPCLSYRCNNGGQCLTNGLNPYCQCVAGFTGQFCDVRIDPCLSYRCNNGGRCLTNGLNPYCQCAQGYTGQFCDTRIDPCIGVVCYNGGRCVARNNLAVCECTQGYVGNLCETRLDPCQIVRCNNGGRCFSRENLAYCECPTGYTGTLCETKLDPCYNYRCENGGRCLAIADRPYCECLLGYTGYRCETVIDPRDYLVCNNTCSLQTSCRICLTCASCQAESQCLDSYKLLKDLDRECQACGYQEALLVKSAQNPLGYSPLRCQRSSNCPAGSACVEDGRGSGTCCRNKVGPNYLDNKPGTCPVETGLTCRGATCLRDSDCAGNLKCCRSCGNQCTNPVLPLSEVCRSCPYGTICATVDRCPSGSTVCPDEQRVRCVPNACSRCGPSEKCKIIFDDRVCRSGQECDSYVYKCVPAQSGSCSSSCTAGTMCSRVGKSCLLEAGRSDKQCEILSRCQEVRRCSECAEGLYCRDTGVRCVTAPCPQSYECVNPCGGCPTGKLCRPSIANNTYECVNVEPCGGCPSGQVCREVQTTCNGRYCVQQRCVSPASDECGGCPAGLKCLYISMGCPTLQCSPATYRCVAGTEAEGQCPPVQSSLLLDFYQCLGWTNERSCRVDRDCLSSNERCCPGNCGTSVCKRVYGKK